MSHSVVAKYFALFYMYALTQSAAIEMCNTSSIQTQQIVIVDRGISSFVGIVQGLLYLASTSQTDPFMGSKRW